MKTYEERQRKYWKNMMKGIVKLNTKYWQLKKIIILPQIAVILSTFIDYRLARAT